MGFTKSAEEMATHQLKTGEFYDAEVLTVFFVTKPEVVESLLPPPLRPAKMPLGFVFVANYPRTNFGVSYSESALFLMTEFNGEEGAYCLAMPVTNDIALILGREIYGYPKKIGNIHLKRQDNEVEGWTERRGVRFLEIQAQLTGTFNDEAAQGAIQEMLQPDQDIVIYNYKYFQSPTRKGFDYNPRLIREVVKLHRYSLEIGKAELVLRSSNHDPWGDIEVVQVLGATYTKSNNTMLPGTIVAEVDQNSFAPYAFTKLDSLKEV